MTADPGWSPSPDLSAGLSRLRIHPVIRMVCMSATAGHPSPREVRSWPMPDVVDMLVLAEAEREAERQARARMRSRRS